jgi:hypothetical protein
MAIDEWMNILKKVQTGELSAEEAARQMDSLESNQAAPGPAIPDADPLPQNPAPDESLPLPGLGWWQNAWLIPVWVGTGILVLSAWLLSWGYANERYFWFYCSWLPLSLGILVLLLGVWSRQARWVHIRIREAAGTNISISLPLPVHLASWVLKMIAPRISDLKDKHLDTLPQVLDALGDSKDPLSVEVDDKNGDRVRVYIQ